MKLSSSQLEHLDSDGFLILSEVFSTQAVETPTSFCGGIRYEYQ